jgi:hypothetical protein
LNTPSTGSLKEHEEVPRRVPLKILLLAGAGLLLALYIGTQVLGVFMGILFPPNPPMLSNATLVRHESTEHGVDSWLYDVSMNSCEVVRYYQDNGGVCNIAPFSCGGTDEFTTDTIGANQHVATCTAEVTFSIFAMRWEANIATGTVPGETQYRLTREVFWTGAVPPRSFTLPESDDLGDN